MWSGWTPAARMPRKTCCAASGRPPAQQAVMSAEYVITLGAHPGSLARRRLHLPKHLRARGPQVGSPSIAQEHGMTLVRAARGRRLHLPKHLRALGPQVGSPSTAQSVE